VRGSGRPRRCGAARNSRVQQAAAYPPSGTASLLRACALILLLVAYCLPACRDGVFETVHEIVKSCPSIMRVRRAKHEGALASQAPAAPSQAPRTQAQLLPCCCYGIAAAWLGLTRQLLVPAERQQAEFEAAPMPGRMLMPRLVGRCLPACLPAPLPQHTPLPASHLPPLTSHHGLQIEEDSLTEGNYSSTLTVVTVEPAGLSPHGSDYAGKVRLLLVGAVGAGKHHTLIGWGALQAPYVPAQAQALNDMQLASWLCPRPNMV